MKQKSWFGGSVPKPKRDETLLCQKEDYFEKKGQNMLHKLSLDADSTVISYWQEREYAYTNIFSFGETTKTDDFYFALSKLI